MGVKLYRMQLGGQHGHLGIGQVRDLRGVLNHARLGMGHAKGQRKREEGGPDHCPILGSGAAASSWSWLSLKPRSPSRKAREASLP